MKPLLLALALGLATAAHAAENGGLVSIPGSPLPSVPKDAVLNVITFYEPLVKALRALQGDTPAIARGWDYLATLYASIGDYEGAERLFRKAEKILQKVEPSGSELAHVHNDRGLVLLTEEKYAEALQSFRRALAILDPARAEFVEPRVVALGNQASAYSLLGDAENSEGAYLEALDLLRRIHREGSSSGQIVRGNLAVLYSTIGDYDAARIILEKLVTEKGLTHPLRFAALNDLGFILAASKNFPEARRRLEDARAMTAGGSQERAVVLMNLASTYALSGDLAHAEEFGQQALQLSQRLYGESSRSAAAAMTQLAVAAMSRGELDKADGLLARATAILSREKGDEEVYVSALRAQALLAQLRGRRDNAMQLSRQALDLAKRELSRMLAFGSETQRLAFRSHAAPYDQLANLGDPALLAEAVLATKGAVLDSLLMERALVHKSTSDADRVQLDRINALKLEIMKKVERGENVDDRARLLKMNETALAKRLALQVHNAQDPVSVAALQSKLADRQVLIEIILYQRYEKGGKLVPWYGGIVIPRNGAPSWVALGASEPIDEKIRNLAAAFNGGNVRSVELIVRSRPVVSPALRELNDTLWEPLSKQLPKNTASILLSPDGATSFLPWAALVDKEDRFLAERRNVVQIGSARDLLGDLPAVHAQTLVALGRPTENLPQIRVEIDGIVSNAEQHGWRAIKILGAEASEGQLGQHPRPGILHLAMHGGVMPESAGNRMSRNPMYRGYVLLEGGEETLRDWARGSASATSPDGVLTAEEASALDLTGTWVTVLSACETGAGDARTGEGVMGLRRGFTLAGTDHLLFTLWRVRDEPTSEFMQAFYKRLFRSGDPVTAFQETQKAELVRWKRETHSAAIAAYHAGGFVLTR